MANRPVFTISDQRPYFEEIGIEFQFFSGFSESQKQKSIASLHNAFIQSYPSSKPLEISTKSTNPIGVALSAFNLSTRLASGDEYPLESVFQGSKVYEYGGPYTDLFSRFPWEAKKDPRLKASGEIISFRLEGFDFPAEPKTYFYDWLYVNAVKNDLRLSEEILNYNAFTDIEFNPKKSLNCQARSAAIFVSLAEKGLLEEAVTSPPSFLNIVYGQGCPQMPEPEQLSLF